MLSNAYKIVYFKNYQKIKKIFEYWETIYDSKYFTDQQGVTSYSTLLSIDNVWLHRAYSNAIGEYFVGAALENSVTQFSAPARADVEPKPNHGTLCRTR